MNAIFTVIPILLIRYGLLGLVNKNALKRAALFAPIIGKEKAAFWVYQITTILILVYLFFLKINFGSSGFMRELPYTVWESFCMPYQQSVMLNRIGTG